MKALWISLLAAGLIGGTALAAPHHAGGGHNGGHPGPVHHATPHHVAPHGQQHHTVPHHTVPHHANHNHHAVGHPNHLHGHRFHPKAVGHGEKFAHGTLYRGYRHNHWGYRYWNGTNRAWYYYDPGIKSYYYWCQPDSCWYPVSYCPYGQYTWDGCVGEDNPDGVPDGCDCEGDEGPTE
jgi:hypothetical protein